MMIRNKTSLFLLCVLFLPLLISSALPAQEDPYKVIATQADLDQITAAVQGMLQVSFSMSLRKPLHVFLVTGQKLDEMYAGAYRGAEIGLYRNAGPAHEIYIIKDKNRDIATATLAHEMTHAWQVENCPADQALVVKEGFARWVEYKVYQKIGAYTIAQNILQVGDPLYGVGFKKMLEWEDSLGERGLVKKVQQVHTLKD